MSLSIRLPRVLQLAAYRLVIGDRTEAVTKLNGLQDELEGFAGEINTQTLPDMETAANQVLSARDQAADAARQAQSAQGDVQAAIETAAEQVAATFNASVVNEALAAVNALPTDTTAPLSANRRYTLPANAQAVMPRQPQAGQWLEFLPAGDLVTQPARLTFAHPVLDSSGRTLAAGTHTYNQARVRRFVFNQGSWR